MESKIPIQNIYYLLTYAWDCLEEGDVVDVAGIESTGLLDLYAAVLLNGLRHILRRGLDQKYVPIEAELAGVRGRVRSADSMRRMLPQHGRMLCEYDELSVDTVPNQIILSTVRKLVATPGVDEGLKAELRALTRALRQITQIPLHRSLFRTVQLYGNNGFYRFLLKVCELILDTALSTEDEGIYRLRDFVRDPVRMPALFQAFIFNFYRHHCRSARVKSERIDWNAVSEDDPELAFLPSMFTDISVRTDQRTLIIDTKFYQRTLLERYGNEKVHSAHLYQLHSYLVNLESRAGTDATAEGMLLYPVVNHRLRLKYTLPKHLMRVCTVDLGASWQEVKQELMDIVR